MSLPNDELVSIKKRAVITVHDGEAICLPIVSVQSLIARLEAAEKAVDAGGCVVDHPAFTIGTKSCEELPKGIMPRIEDFRKAEEAWRKAKGEI